jgi:hypothetical protein
MLFLYDKEKIKNELRIRKEIVLENAIPKLIEKGYEKSIFSTSEFGYHPSLGYFYELCRGRNNRLEVIEISVLRDERWIQISLNIFELNPTLSSIRQFKGLEGTKFNLLPNTQTKMRLRSDEYKGMPLFHILFSKKHKLGSYFSKRGLNKRIFQLRNLIENDMKNIDYFVEKWYELHKPNLTTWEGILIEI